MLRETMGKSKEVLFQSYLSYYNALTSRGYYAQFGQNTFSIDEKDCGVSSYLRHRMLDCGNYKGFGISAQNMNSIGISYNMFKNVRLKRDVLMFRNFESETFYKLPPTELLHKYIAISAYYGGFSLETASRVLGKDANVYYRDEIDFCESNGLLKMDNKRVRITPKGFKYYGAVFSLFYFKQI